MGFLYRGHFFTKADRHTPGFICHTHKDEQGRKIGTSFVPKEHPCRLAIQAWSAHNDTVRTWQAYQYAINNQPLRGMSLEEHKAAWERCVAKETEALSRLS